MEGLAGGTPSPRRAHHGRPPDPRAAPITDGRFHPHAGPITDGRFHPRAGPITDGRFHPHAGPITDGRFHPRAGPITDRCPPPQATRARAYLRKLAGARELSEDKPSPRAYLDRSSEPRRVL
jgi:hypothetical protein